MNAQQMLRAGHRRRLETALCAALAILWAGLAAHPPIDPTRVRPEVTAPPGAEVRSWDRAPTPIHVVRPEYPSFAQATGLEGGVRLLVTVGPDGAVLEVIVLSSTSEMFEEPARAALRQWRFQPAELNGQPVAATVLVPFCFRLDR